MTICKLCRIPQADDNVTEESICFQCEYQAEQLAGKVEVRDYFYHKPVGAITTCYEHRRRSCQVCFPGS